MLLFYWFKRSLKSRLSWLFVNIFLIFCVFLNWNSLRLIKKKLFLNLSDLLFYFLRIILFLNPICFVWFFQKLWFIYTFCKVCWCFILHQHRFFTILFPFKFCGIYCLLFSVKRTCGRWSKFIFLLLHNLWLSIRFQGFLRFFLLD